MNSVRKKIGIMGGTFDPIHMGHLMLAETAYEQFALDQVLFLPAGNPPHKRNRTGRASNEERIEMVRLAISDNPHFALSLIEMKQKEGYTYTYHTLETLKSENPDTDYYFIIGADSLFDFSAWKEPGRICDACTLIVAVRDQTSAAQLNHEMDILSRRYNGRFLKLDSVNIDISSHMLRQRIQEAKSLRYYVPDTVLRYIETHHIYI
jgi:nicotinate-nucleotide adenylyltransferase